MAVQTERHCCKQDEPRASQRACCRRCILVLRCGVHGLQRLVAFSLCILFIVYRGCMNIRIPFCQNHIRFY